MGETAWFDAPWGKLLWTFTSVATVVMLSVPVVMWKAGAPGLLGWGLGGVMIVTWTTCALFAVRGYRLEAGDLVIERPFWDTRVSLAGLQSVRHDKDLISGAIRVGNGGLFAFAGWFWSKQHGWFHLAGNDILGRCVLLEWADQKWMITPGDPEGFVLQFKGQIPGE
jgi:hypothetical protein